MLTPRLKRITEYVDCGVAADIGTDHAYVPVELIKSGRARAVIASDVREGPLAAAAANTEKNGVGDRIELRLGSGLSVLRPGEADTVIIAGMGGILISDILNADMETAKRSMLVLQPMNAQYELRKWLSENGFKVISEAIECEDHHVYNIIAVREGTEDGYGKDIDFHIPTILYDDPNFEKLYDKKMREFLKIVSGLERAGECDDGKLEYYRNALKELKEAGSYVGKRNNKKN